MVGEGSGGIRFASPPRTKNKAAAEAPKRSQSMPLALYKPPMDRGSLMMAVPPTPPNLRPNGRCSAPAPQVERETASEGVVHFSGNCRQYSVKFKNGNMN